MKTKNKTNFWLYKYLLSLCLFLFFFLIITGTIYAETEKLKHNEHHKKKFIVATKIFPPFVMKEGENLVGFTIDLWEEMVHVMDVDYEFLMQTNVPDLLGAVTSKKADLGMSAISLTYEREQILDFSYVFFDSGLQIMISTKKKTFYDDLLASLWHSGLIKAIIAFGIIILIAAHIIWLIERKKNEKEFPKSYINGIFEGIWWTIVTCTTVGYGDKTPKTRLGRLFGIIWMTAGLFFIASFTASITSSLTTTKIKNLINNPTDLAGKKIGTIAGTTSYKYLNKQLGIIVKGYSTLEKLYSALDKGKIQAVVYDSPALLYYASKQGKEKVRVVGPVFNEEGYSIALPSGSIYREMINEALLKVKENGKYNSIYRRWFSENSEGPE